MSYLVFARKYRPQVFEELEGQEHITQVLKKSIKEGRIHHAFIFSGPRGVGKTSCARILAKALNCLSTSKPTPTPCLKCRSCIEIKEGRSLDVIEIDGASNRGIDEIRALKDAIKFSPVSGRYKIYIIDEVHQITGPAFNALLKTLEEPPSHVKFIMATTSIERVPSTILSRCQKFNFRLVPVNKIMNKLKMIRDKENINMDDEVLYLIAQAGNGSIRDAESIFDQICSLAGESKISPQDIFPILGIIEHQKLYEFAQSIGTSNTPEALNLLEELIEEGKNIVKFLDASINYFRNLLMVKVAHSRINKLIDLPPQQIKDLVSQSQMFNIHQLLNIIETFLDAKQKMRLVGDPRIPLELAIVKIHSSNNIYSDSQNPLETLESKDISKENTSVLKVKFSSNSSINTSSPTQTHIKDVLKKVDSIISNSKKNNSTHLQLKDVNKDEIIHKWKEFLQDIEKKKRFVYEYLKDSVIEEVNKDTLIVGIRGNSFQKEHLEKKENIEFLETSFSKYTGINVKIKFHLKPPQKEEKPQEQTKSENVVKNILKIFKGEIIR